MAIHEPNYHQERRDAAYQKIQGNFFAGNSLLLALIMGQGKIVEAASFSDLFHLFSSLSATRPNFFKWVRWYLIPKMSNEDDCRSVYKLCNLPDEEASIVIEKIAEFMKARKAKFWEYTNLFKSTLGHLQNRDICKQFPVLAQAWFSSVSSDDELEVALRCCHTDIDEVSALQAWFESLFVKPYEELGKDAAKFLREEALVEMRESLMSDINSGENPTYTKILKYLILDTEIRQFSYLLSEDPYAVTRQSCDTMPFQDYRIGGAADTEKE